MPDFLSNVDRLAGTVTQLGAAALPWYEARNAHENRQDVIRGRETIDLARLGFTTGRASIATVPRGAVVPSFGGGSVGIGSLGAYAPLLLGLGLLLVLKK